MDIIIKTPTLAIANNITSEEYVILKKLATYKNKTVINQVNRLRNNKWLKNKNYVQWEEQLRELKKEITKCVVNFSSDAVTFKSGFIPYIQEKIGVNIVNEVKYPKGSPYKFIKPIPFELYEYQKKSVEELIKAKHGHVSLCTGSGKTACILLIAQRLGLKTVVITPSKSIFQGIYKDFQEHLGKGIVGAYGDGKKDLSKPITIAIAKSLTMVKKGSDAESFFNDKQVMLIDESHTFPSATLEKVNHGLLANTPYRLFFSATQTRNDGQIPVLQSIIGKCVCELELEEAIKGGYLCPLEFYVIKTISPSTKYKPDPIECKREHLLYNTNVASIYAQITNATVEKAGKSVLILVEELVQIGMLQRLLKVPFTYIHSASAKDAAKNGLNKVKQEVELERFNTGEVKVLIGTKSIAIGTNIYPTHVVLNWAGGSSEILVKQGVMGRSTRKLELSKYKNYHKPKPFSKIIDINITNQHLLTKALGKRIEFYEETGEEVHFIDKNWNV